jgi:hypothetical protein
MPMSVRPRESGDPECRAVALDSRLRGNETEIWGAVRNQDVGARDERGHDGWMGGGLQ